MADRSTSVRSRRDHSRQSAMETRLVSEEDDENRDIAYPLVSLQSSSERHRNNKPQYQRELLDLQFFSNDVEDIKEAAEALGEGGYPIRYSCEREAGDVQVNTMQVRFDYEFVTLGSEQLSSSGSILPPTLPAAEWGTLWTTANQLGLHGCQFSQQSILPSGRLLGADGPTLIVSLSSLPVDSFDTSVASCQYLQILHPGRQCYAMKGVMTVGYTGNNTEAVVAYLQREIENELDTQQTLTGGVQRTMYLGNRTISEVPATTDPPPVEGPGRSTTSNDPQQRTMTIAVATSLSVAAVVGILVAAFFLTRRRRRHTSAARGKTDLTHQDSGDIEKAETQSSSPASDDEVSSTVFVSFGSPAGPMIPPGPDKPDAKPGQESPTRSTITAKSIGSSTTIPISNRRPTTPDSLLDCTTDTMSLGSASAGSDDAVRAATPTRSTEENQPAKMVDVLPPLPPTGPSTKLPPGALPPSSKTMKRRRRRKKKGKRKLTRVNSRENVKEMETIAEGEEDYDDDEDGSEYSWSTDESDASRSREPSPARSSDASGDFSSPNRSIC